MMKIVYASGFNLVAVAAWMIMYYNMIAGVSVVLCFLVSVHVDLVVNYNMESGWQNVDKS